ncbi:MAG TPA: 3-oxoacyl-[acyl-carrier-protein] synthase III C-terminal domain-containing protein [Streptosporangiaceae bacterium]|nr:3-oxoacyl-[acyl-carrier-protein] synthase III C-terminal domain-containing protein [Streptosporangiaceae bacterium]
MSGTALDSVAAYLPPASIPIGSLPLGISDDQFLMYRRLCGLSTVRRAEDGTIADLMLAAAAGLTTLAGRECHVRYVVHALTLTSCAPYPVNPLHEVTRRLGLAHAQAFSLTQHGCASGLLAIELCGRLLAADPDPAALALVFSGERVFTRRLEHIPGTAIMGEGAAAVLVTSHGTRDRLLGHASRTYGRYSAGPDLGADLEQEFRELCLTALAEVILAAVQRAGCGLDDIALVLPHNVNRLVWTRLAKRLQLDPARVMLANVAATGHCFGADPFINYRTAVEQRLLRRGDRYVMATLGLGAAFCAQVFEH